MCGVAGILVDVSMPVDIGFLESTVRRMTNSLASRGPDGEGVFASERIALGHRRLSILEVGSSGAQPMQIGDDGPIISFNGEIYNCNELRDELSSLGVGSWKGRSDTEVILRLYNKAGLDGLKRLEGIFSIALWDRANDRLILMRDRLGVKPMFYGFSDLGLAFGSEIKAVIAAGGVDTTLNDQSFSEYLWFGNVHEDRTFYQGVIALEPGQWMVVEGGMKRLEYWWRIEEWIHASMKIKNESEAIAFVRNALDAAVDRQLVADVPVGIFLSGGVDSSAIAASAMRTRQIQLNSFAAGFDFLNGVNELPKAADVARSLGLCHHEFQISGSELENTLLKLAFAHDEPFADAANIPLYLMCMRLQGQVKVVLQGDGGDELFAGYRRYSMIKYAHLWRLWPKFLSPFVNDFGVYGQRFIRMADSLGQEDPSMLMAMMLTVETLRHPPEGLFRRDRKKHLINNTDPFLAYRRAAKRFDKYEPVQKMLLTDLTVQLPSQFLTKVDRATMAAGIEARVPLLDEGIASLAVGLPASWNLKGFQKKIILRNSQRGRIADKILDGPKTGFGVPYEEWLRTSLFEFTRSYILDNKFLDRFDLDGFAVERMLCQHRDHKNNRGMMLWKLLQLALWKSK